MPTPRRLPNLSPRRRRGAIGLTVALAAALVVLVACGGGDSGSEGSPAATAPAPATRMTDAVAQLCVARDEARDRPKAAEARFFDRSHTTLHDIARVLEDVDRPSAARLLEAKQRVEADFSGLASGERVADDLGRLVVVTAEGLDRLAVPRPPCAK